MTKILSCSCSPLLGDTGHTRTQIKTSKGPVPDPEERGGDREGGGRKRTSKVLARWPPDQGTIRKTTPQRKQVKRLAGTAVGKETGGKDGRGREQENFLWTWMEAGKEGKALGTRPRE